MGTEGTDEQEPILALSLPDPRILHAGAIAINRYNQRAKYIRECMDSDPRTKIMLPSERDEMAKRLMRRLVERS